MEVALHRTALASYAMHEYLLILYTVHSMKPSRDWYPADDISNTLAWQAPINGAYYWIYTGRALVNNISTVSNEY